MIDRTHCALVAILLLTPVAAHAQHGATAPHPASHAAPASAVAPEPAEPPFPGDALDVGDPWLEDDLLAFALADDFFLDGADFEGDEPGMVGDGDMTTEDSPGPDADRRIVVRRTLEGPGMEPGAGMRTGLHGGRTGTMSMRGHGGPRMHRRMGLAARLAQLDLTDAQREKLRALHEAQARKAIQRRADMQLARLDLHKLMRAEKPDPSAVNAQIDRLARLHAEGLKGAFETRMQARAVLTPEQVKKLHGPMGAPMMRHEMMDSPGDRPKR